MAAEQNQDSKANIKVEKHPNGQVRVVIEGLSIAGNMMDVEEGVLQYLNQAGGIADLDPDAARAGSIPAVDSFGNDALCANPAGVREDDGAVLGEVFIEQDASRGIAQQPCQCGLAVEERAIAHILAVVLDVKHRSVCGLPTAQLLEA
jgi:hypothetical protein